MLSANCAGRTAEALAALLQAEIEAIRTFAGDRLRAAGVDYLIDTVADLPDLVERLDEEWA